MRGFYNAVQVCHGLCLVCGLLVTGTLVYIAYHHLLKSSSETEVSRSEYKVAEKEEKSPTEVKLTPRKKMSKEFDSDVIPAAVLGQIGDVTVLKKTATFSVGGHVSFVQDTC